MDLTNISFTANPSTDDFVYAVDLSVENLTNSMHECQFNFAGNPEEGIYQLDVLLEQHTIVAAKIPAPYVPLYVSILTREEIDQTVYYNVYRTPNGQLTILPRFNIELTDTQFKETGLVSISRTILGAVISVFENIEIAEIDYSQGFKVIDTNLIFQFSIDTKGDGKATQPFNLSLYGQSIGRVSLEELIDDTIDFDDLTKQFVQNSIKGK